MIQEPDLADLEIGLERVSGPRVGFGLDPPLHGGADEALARNAGQALGDQLGGVSRSRRPIAALGAGDRHRRSERR